METWTTYGEALRMFVRGATVRVAGKIALIVGTWLTLMNHGELILRGEFPWAKIVLNFATPFTVASLGFLSARRRENVERLVKLLDQSASE